nr:hypothetical protein [Tanacetum cinerariifolium]
MYRFNLIVRAFASLGHDLGNSYVYDPNPNSFDCPLDSYHPPHPTYDTYSYDAYGNDSQFGYDCQPQFLLNYESKPGYNENYTSYPYDSSSLSQQYLCCARCGGPHETCHCDQLIFDEPYCKHCGGQLMNQESYNPNSLGFDQPQPPQSPVIHQPPHELSIQEMEDLKQQYLDELQRLSNLEYRDEINIAKLKENFNEVMEIVIPEVGGIDDDILLTIDHDVLHLKLLNVNLLISKIEALNANHTPSSDCKTKSSSTSLNSLLEETNTFDNSLLEFETFCFDVKEISSGSTTTPPDLSLPKYKAFHDDHVKEISSGSPTTHSDSPLYASLMFDLSINLFPLADRSDSYEFTDELIPFISAPESSILFSYIQLFLTIFYPYGMKISFLIPVKENQENDNIGSKPDKNKKRSEFGKNLKHLQ